MPPDHVQRTNWQRGPSPPTREVSVPKQQAPPPPLSPVPIIIKQEQPYFPKAPPAATPTVETSSSVVFVKTEEPAPTPAAPEPEPPAGLPTPEPSAPSPYVLALTRLADLEAQMEFAFAKHLQLMTAGKRLHVQTETLRDLPVGLECFKEDLDAFTAQYKERSEKESEQKAAEEAFYDLDA
jgi:hypothetical protein